MFRTQRTRICLSRARTRDENDLASKVRYVVDTPRWVRREGLQHGRYMTTHVYSWEWHKVGEVGRP